MKNGYFILTMFLISFLALSTTKVFAQDDEYQKWLKEEQNKINTFMSEEDKKFTEFLDKEWKEFKMSNGIKFDEKPKITKPPVFSGELNKTDKQNTKDNKEPKTTDIKKQEPPKGEKPVLSDSKNPFKENEKPKLTDKKEPEDIKEPILKETEDITKKDPVVIPEKIVPKVEDVAKQEPPKKITEPEKTNKLPETDKKFVEPKKVVEETPKEIPATETVVVPGIVPGIDLNKNDSEVKIDYFGAGILFQYAKSVKVNMSGKVNNKAISKFWEDISTKNYKDLILQFEYYKKKMQLNDWGYALLVNDIGTKLYNKDRNSKHLFIWFILTKTGYKSKVGFIDNKVVLFMPAKNKIFGVSYFTSSDTKERLYVIDFDNLTGPLDGSIYTYDGDYPDSKILVDMSVKQAPKIGDLNKERTINFKYKGVDYTVPVKYNLSTVNFYEYYPYSSLDVYFNSGVSDITKESLLNSLRPLIEGKSEPDAANILLRFVQIGFEYQTDDQQFKREKPFFIEESMYYRYCDCEDRAILYTFLVKNLLGLPVIGVDYPGHVASAVKFSVDVPGDFVMFNNKKYTVCDPTYINAYIGMAMPQFKEGKYEALIDVKN